jgi:DNA polymerase III delta prime subunit
LKLAVYLIYYYTVRQVCHTKRKHEQSSANSVGTGKTSTVLALARRLYGTAYRKHILELNASDDSGIDVVRDQIKSFAMTKVLFSYVFSFPDGDGYQVAKDMDKGHGRELIR